MSNMEFSDDVLKSNEGVKMSLLDSDCLRAIDYGLVKSIVLSNSLRDLKGSLSTFSNLESMFNLYHYGRDFFFVYFLKESE